MGICELLNTYFLGIENSGTFISYLRVAMPVFNSFRCQVKLFCKNMCILSGLRFTSNLYLNIYCLRRKNIYKLPVLVPLIDNDIKHEQRLFSNTTYPRNWSRNVLTTATKASILLLIGETPEKLSPWPRESI